ncbi:hypothetical protein G7Z17_g8830 [Cylindrodendrum hubeiense]|uniref:Uncharacterized protein n=1 Tax=Cylindrodendrum hubeiense TaxID=595255 RepID=A0A9P5H7U5_9HYPO|nr:hypothetical protein G7Z17_g8830 [Cylindrodendrum hubeiense]
MAATFDGSITPPPPTGIRTPPTPRLGYHDNWEPFTPRKSARISSQRTRTPSPSSSHRQQPRSPRTVKKSIKQTIVSPMHSPQKKRQPALDSVRRASGVMSAEGTQAATALGFQDAPAQRPANLSITRASGMLPTPSKTPQKPPNEKTAANIKSFARNLFPSEAEAMLSPKKRRAKKYTGISMDSFTVEEVEEPIEIFTDSQDRVPTKDESEANPFYGDDAAPAEPSKRRSKRKQVTIPGEGAYSIDEASRREDGMVYVFRGKKFFRKFCDDDNEDADELLDDEVEDELRLARPLTRSSIKPRLLFQTEKTEAMIEDEEAATDVEDELIDEPAAEPQTPVKPHHQRASTPEAPKFAPVSPPDTRRTTRSTNKLAEQSTPIKPTGRKSPFDSWRRTKEHKAASSTKRQGESLTPAHAKRTRI